MLYLLVKSLESFLTKHDLFGLVRVLTYIEFRALASVLVSCAIVIVLGPTVIRWLIKQKIGDNPEFNNQTLNQLTQTKANTPTMGGILIVGSILATTLLLADMTNFYIQMGILCLVWLAALGSVDDWLKLTTARRKTGSRQGLYGREKLLFQVGLAMLLGVFIYYHGQNKFQIDLGGIELMSHSLNLPFMKSWEFSGTSWVPSTHLIVLGAPLFVLLTIMVVTGSSNAVNLTDGMDGLASGIMAMCGFAFLILCLLAGWEGGAAAKQLLIPFIPLSSELAIMSGAIVGACLGFLWYNCSPAQVFMGDTGSLALGGLIGYIAVVIRQEFLLLIIGGVFAMEAVSVMLQVGYFKYTKRKHAEGKRLFLCAPIHHHFQLKGWKEQQVVVRFWLITAILIILALSTIKLR